MRETKTSPTKILTATPFLKWVGGKKSILPDLIKRLPSDLSVYYEPFLGGGALFFEVGPPKALLSDTNPHLIITYTAVRDRLDDVINLLQEHNKKHKVDDPTYYYEQRDLLRVDNKDIAVQGARFIYLNKTCFNGLYRVNKAGYFNVPFGDYSKPLILDVPTLKLASKALQGVYLICRDFKKVKGKGFFYFDPPYHQAFNNYTKSSFGEDQQTELANHCRYLDKLGSKFMLSNSDTPLVRELYKGFNIERVISRRSISCKASQREKVYELVVRNYE